MTKFCQCLFLAVLLSTSFARAANEKDNPFIAVNWRNGDGLPHSIINTVVQGTDGYLWVGTYVGLVRFDGIRFIHYSSAEMPELGDGRVVNLFVGRDGTLWAALEGGRLVAVQNGRARIHIEGKSLNSEPIVAMAQDPAGTIWFYTAAGDFGKLTAEGVEVCARLGGAMPRSNRILFSDQNGQIWVGTPDGLKFWRNGALIVPESWPAALHATVDSAAPAHDGSILVLRDRQLWRCDGSNAPVIINTPAEIGNILNLLEDSEGRIWLGAANGLLYCRTLEGNWHELDRQSLPGSNRVLFEDREGNIWRGSFGGGLARIQRRLFTMHELVNPNIDSYVRSASADAAGNLWAVMSSESIARIRAGQSKAEEWNASTVPLSFRTILADHKDGIWVGARSSTLLYRLDENGYRPIPRPNTSAEAIDAIYEDSHHNLWLGYLGGPGLSCIPNGDPSKWRDMEGVSLPDVRAIIEAPDGAMWFGTHYGGVYRLKDGQWTHFTTRDGLPSDYCRCFLVDSEQNLWLGTIKGMCRWREGKFVSITSHDGLWNDSLSYLAEDESGNIWAGSFNGIFRASRQMLNDFADGKRNSVECVSYGRNDGLTSLECPGACQPAGAKTPDGQLWIPTVSGIVSVLPASIKENKTLPPVWIEEIGIDGKVTTIKHDTTAVTVPPGKRRIDFRFTGLSLSAPEKVQFRHKLTRLDLEWSPVDTRRTASYSYIPPGEYTFEVVACNNDGIWNEKGHALRLVIQPFFWQTWWFKVSVGGVLVLALVFGVRQVERWRTKIQLERVEQKHAIEHERNRIAKDIHDDLGANLTQIVFLSQRAEGASHDQKEVEHWLRKIPAIARRTIQSLDEIVWAINPKHDSLESLANYISQFAQEHLRLAGLRCVLDVPTVLPPVSLSAEVRHNLVLSVREAVQNVVAHADATEATVALQLDAEKLTIIVKDNGRGFDSSRKSEAGNGLPNMQRRIEDIGGIFTINSKLGAGTEMQVILSRSRLSGRTAGLANAASLL